MKTRGSGEQLERMMIFAMVMAECTVVESFNTQVTFLRSICNTDYGGAFEQNPRKERRHSERFLKTHHRRWRETLHKSRRGKGNQAAKSHRHHDGFLGPCLLRRVLSIEVCNGRLKIFIQTASSSPPNLCCHQTPDPRPRETRWGITIRLK